MSNLEAAFAFYWHLLTGEGEPVRQHRFHPDRRWRFDFAWPEALVAVECEGGIWTQGRHVRGRGFRNDCEKYNAATALGWSVFRITRGILEEDPESLIAMIEEAIDGRNG